MEFLRWLECYYSNTFTVLMLMVIIIIVGLLSFMAAFQPTYLLLTALSAIAIVFVGAIFKTIYLYFGEYRAEKH